MDQRFKERIEQNALIEKYQNDIDTFLMQNPELASFQKGIEEQLDKIGDITTPEGRMNRSALMFSMLRDSFLKFSEGLDEYQKLLTQALETKK